jgi:hypothetical protein
VFTVNGSRTATMRERGQVIVIFAIFLPVVLGLGAIV